MEQDRLDLIITAGIIGGVLFLLALLRWHAREKRRPVSPQPHEMRFDDSGLRERVAAKRVAARPAGDAKLPSWRSAEHHIPLKRERPLER